MRWIIVMLPAAMLAGCGSQAKPSEDAVEAVPAVSEPKATPPGTTAPDLAACPAREPVDEGLRQRSTAIPMPPALRETMLADMNNFAIATLGGGTVCVDASWIESIRDPALSADRRFASFGWDGYESYGHLIVDRNGRGQVIDTGVAPVASPSGKRLAAVDLSESGFGALNAFAVWEIAPDTLRELAKQEEAPQEVTDWRIERWTGETCIELSAVSWDDMTSETRIPRQPFKARASDGWRLEPGRCPAA